MVQLDSKRWSYKGDKTFLESYFILKKVSAVSTYTVHISQKRKGRSHVLLLPRDWSRINVILYIWLKNIWLYILDFCKNNVFNESLWIQDGPAAATPSLGFLGSADAVDWEVAPILGFARADGSWPVAQAYCRRRRLPSHWDRGRGGGSPSARVVVEVATFRVSGCQGWRRRVGSPVGGCGRRRGQRRRPRSRACAVLASAVVEGDNGGTGARRSQRTVTDVGERSRPTTVHRGWASARLRLPCATGNSPRAWRETARIPPSDWMLFDLLPSFLLPLCANVGQYIYGHTAV